jgi:hypothetical protein
LRSPSIVFAEPEVTLRFVFKNAYWKLCPYIFFCTKI